MRLRLLACFQTLCAQSGDVEKYRTSVRVAGAVFLVMIVLGRIFSTLLVSLVILLAVLSCGYLFSILKCATAESSVSVGHWSVCSSALADFYSLTAGLASSP